nr:malic enzyme-like NAD(P)-binding protein [Halanaerobium congolense]
MMSIKEEALKLHKENKGKITVNSKMKVENKEDLSLVYTPGVAEPCREIEKDTNKVYDYTSKGNLVAVVSDGTAVLGLGDIGAEASMPVMEGKSVLFKEFGGVDAFPICLNTTDVDEIVETVKRLEPGFGGINLEDISSPRCVEIENKLKEELNIPVFHDDQHGTAIVVLSGLINAAKFVEKDLENMKVVVNGAGSAGIAITKLLLSIGVKDVIICDIFGILHPGQDKMNQLQSEIAAVTNQEEKTGDLAEALKGADAFIGVSAPDIVSKEMIGTMAEDAVVFAMANPVPEIDPVAAKKGGAKVVGTGRSDYANQVNNVLAFPGIFRGALDVRASDINEEMKIAAAYGIASLINEDQLTAEYVIPDPFDKRVAEIVAEKVAQAAVDSGVARK